MLRRTSVRMLATGSGGHDAVVQYFLNLAFGESGAAYVFWAYVQQAVAVKYSDGTLLSFNSSATALPEILHNQLQSWALNPAGSIRVPDIAVGDALRMAKPMAASLDRHRMYSNSEARLVRVGTADTPDPATDAWPNTLRSIPGKFAVLVRLVELTGIRMPSHLARSMCESDDVLNVPAPFSPASSLAKREEGTGAATMPPVVKGIYPVDVFAEVVRAAAHEQVKAESLRALGGGAHKFNFTAFHSRLVEEYENSLPWSADTASLKAGEAQKLGQCLLRAGKVTEAQEVIERALEQAEKVPGASWMPAVLNLQASLAEVYEELDQTLSIRIYQ